MAKPKRISSLMNCVISVDLDLLSKQITWLAGLGISSPERDGILNLLEGIQDLADPIEEEVLNG